jgi:hypothetical protein
MTLTDNYDIPSARDTAAGAVGQRGPREFLVAWFLITAFIILTSSIGLIGTLLLLPLALFMLAVGLVWVGIHRVRA